MSLFHFWLGSEYQKWREKEKQNVSPSLFISLPLLFLAIFVILVVATIIWIFLVVFQINILTL